MKPAAALSTFKGRTKDFTNSLFVLGLLTSIRSKMDGLKGHLLAQSKNDAVEKMQRTIEELSQQNAIKNRMLSIVSHDMRAPLDSLKSLLPLVKNRTIKQGELQEVMGGLSHQVDQLSHFLENILRWIGNQSSEIKPEFGQLSLHRIVKETVALLHLQAKRKNVFIYDNISSNIIVFADEEMIKLVIRNLVANAIKYCYANDSIHIRAREQEGKVVVSVHDTGRGVSSDRIPTLFELSHLSFKGTKNEIGTGLGLTLCREFVEKMGGKITATSVEGKGSCFEFSVHSPISATAEFRDFIESNENAKAQKNIS